MNLKILLALLLLSSCRSLHKAPTAQVYDFPTPVATDNRPVDAMTKGVFSTIGSLQASNTFDGARLNDFQYINDSTYRVVITPENEPINPSPWYAFNIWSSHRQDARITIDYGNYHHRYHPKISRDGETWQILDSTRVVMHDDSTSVDLLLSFASDTLWVAAQEVIGTEQVRGWCRQLARHDAVSLDTIGRTSLGRPLFQLDIGSGRSRNKPMVVILSRQHPPEVTGFMALQAFLDKVLDNSPLSREFLDRYRLLVFPLMNPDGVDLGHWRHNSGGVDLNRDWAFYRQTETRLVADQIVRQAYLRRNQVLLGLDFHSTWYDVYYTNTLDPDTALPEFTDLWLSAIENAIPGYKVDERPSGLGRPVSKSWFFTQFKAVGITYEIGDNTDRDFVRLKGEASARSLMELLLEQIPKVRK